MKFIDVNKILIIKLRHIGDVLLTVPAIRAVRERFPDAYIAALVNKGTEEMLTDNPLLNEVAVYDRTIKEKPFFTRIGRELNFFRYLRSKRFDMTIDLTSGDRPALYSYFCGARYRIGYEPKGGFWGKSLIYTHRGKQLSGRNHVVLQCLHLLKQFGISTNNLKVEIFFSDKEREYIDKLLSRNGVGPSEPIIHIHTTSRWLFKCWKDEYMAEVIGWLLDIGMKVVITSSPDVREMEKVKNILSLVCSRFTVHGSRLIDLSGRTTLKHLAVLSKRAILFFGVDSAPMHIAAAVGTPVVALFGPTGAYDWGPWDNGDSSKFKIQDSKSATPYPEKNGVQRSALHCVIQKNWDCIPCGKDGCKGSKRSDCLETIQLKEVLGHIQEKIDVSIPRKSSFVVGGIKRSRNLRPSDQMNSQGKSHGKQRYQKALRIAFLSRKFWREHESSGNIGGTEQARLQEYRNLGCKVTILTQGDGISGFDERDINGIPVVVFDAKRRKYKMAAFDKLSKIFTEYRKVFTDAMMLKEFLRRYGPFDLLETQTEEPDGLVAAIASLLYNDFPKLVTQVYAFRYKINNGKPHYRYRSLFQFIFQRSALIKANSYMVRNILLDKFHCPDDKIIVVPHCLTMNFFNPEIDSKEFRIFARGWFSKRFNMPPPRYLVVSLSGLAKKKGLEYLIRAIPIVDREVPGVLFVIGGGKGRREDEHADSLNSLATQMGLKHNLIFAGKINFDEVPLFLGAADVVVISSIIDEFNRVAVEANAVGVPVVITQGCGATSWIRRFESGTVVPVADYYALAKGMIRLLKNPSISKRMGKNGLLLKKEFHPGHLARESVRHYEVVLKEVLRQPS